MCPGVQVSASGCTRTVLIGVWIIQPWSPRFCCAGWPGSTTLQNEIWPKMFRCFRTNLVELTPFYNSWPITDTNSVLCAFENCVILQSIRNTSLAHLWQDCCANTNLLTEYTVAGLHISLEGQIKEVMHKAFWDSLEESLREDPPDYTHALVLLKEVKEVIIIIVITTMIIIYDNDLKLVIMLRKCRWLC